ncbi:MAG: response regulator [Candidatus Delongbacteria bacterium]|nr:response regulator [Candidatus Delongbacteria bacterium]MBN2837115.1 response regulator [Candidatus Delongbacteria bacterium]
MRNKINKLLIPHLIFLFFTILFFILIEVAQSYSHNKKILNNSIKEFNISISRRSEAILKIVNKVIENSESFVNFWQKEDFTEVNKALSTTFPDNFRNMINKVRIYDQFRIKRAEKIFTISPLERETSFQLLKTFNTYKELEGFEQVAGDKISYLITYPVFINGTLTFVVEIEMNLKQIMEDINSRYSVYSLIWLQNDNNIEKRFIEDQHNKVFINKNQLTENFYSYINKIINYQENTAHFTFQPSFGVMTIEHLKNFDNHYTATIHFFKDNQADSHLLTIIIIIIGTLILYLKSSSIDKKNINLIEGKIAENNKLLDKIDELKEELSVLSNSMFNYKELSDASFESVIFSENGICVAANKTTSIYFGVPENEVIGQDLVRFIDDQYISIVQKTMLTNDESPYEILCRKIDGTRFYALVRGKNIILKNKTIRLSVLRDISDIKNSEIKLEKALKEAQEASLAKSEFLSNVSHELRTPLNSIVGFSDLLSKKNTDPTMNEYINIIKSSSDWLLKIINDIIHLSKIESGRVPVSIKSVNLKSLISNLMMMFKDNADKKQIELRSNIPSIMPDIINTDEALLNRALSEIFINSINFTDKGYVLIDINAENINESRMDLSIRIEDTGKGISEEKKKNIFEPFLNNDNTQIKNIDSIGIGLTIAKKSLELLGGSISLESIEGSGSVFIIKFSGIELSYQSNIGNVESRFFESYIEDDILFHDGLILVVDDISINRKLILKNLEMCGLSFIEADNGAQAIEIAEKFLPNMILLDAKMPVMDGYEAIKILKMNPKTAQIPTVLVTASDDDDIDEQVRDKFDDILKKPIIKRDLINILTRYFKEVESNNLLVKTSNFEIIETSLDDLVLNNENIDNIQTILNIWKSAKNSMTINEIDEFIDELKEFSIKFNSDAISAYADRLKVANDTFDLEKITITLQEFEIISGKLEEYNE